MSVERQQRRQRERELTKRAESVLKKGLAQVPHKDGLAAVAFMLRGTLADERVKDRASRAAGIAHRLFEASVKATPSQMELACRMGCAYCCHSWVSATAPELFLIAAEVRKTIGADQARAASLAERVDMVAGLSVAERFGRKAPCPLLSDSKCSVYAVRPTVCRQATSTDVASCVDEYEGKDFGGEIGVSKLMVDHARNCQLPLKAALRSLRLPTHGYELAGGLGVAMTPEAEESWLAGKDPFAGVARAPADAGPIQQVVETLAKEIAP